LSDSGNVLLLGVAMILGPFVIGSFVAVPFVVSAVSDVLGVVIFIVAILSYASR
jgi:hypothetical protein